MQKNSVKVSLYVNTARFWGFDMIFIGLTGSISTGKSTVAKMFKEKGCYIIDADTIAHGVYKKGKNAYNKIIQTFGKEILDKNGNIDRKKLGSLVLKDKGKLKKLESIVHPEVEKERNKKIKEITRKNRDAVIIYDVPLLFEKNLQDMFDYTVVVYTDKDTEIRRLMNRDKISQEEAIKKISMQMSIEDKAKMADFVIDNSKDLDYTKKQVEVLLKNIKQKHNERV